MTDGLLLQCFVNSIYGSLMVIVVLLIRRLMKGKVPYRYFCFLWLTVMLRLAVPVSFENSFGILPEASYIFGIFERTEDIKESAVGTEYYSPVLSTAKKSNETQQMSDPTGIPRKQDNVKSGGLNAESRFLYVLWLSGSAVMAGYMIISLVITRRRLRFAVPNVYKIRLKPADDEYTDVKVYLDEDISVPFLYGFLRPRIYLPYDLTRDEAEHVIRHELSHIKRHDQIVKPVCFMVLAFYWYCPFVWIAFRMLSEDIELACDESVVLGYDEDLKSGYAEALLNVSGGGLNMRLSALPFGKTPVENRIRAVLNNKRQGVAGRCIIIFAMVLIAVLFSTVRVHAAFDDAAITDYDSVIPMIDEESGKRYLLVPYKKDMNAYEMHILSEGLEDEVRANSNEFWYERPLSEYTIRKNEKTGLSYIVRKGEAVWMGHVLLYNDRDRRIYDALAQDYAGRYPEVIMDADLGYQYADYEVKGLGGRCENGFWFLQTGTLMYIDLKKPSGNIRRLALTTDEYMRLEKWLSENGTPDFDVTEPDEWKSTFDALDIEYDIPLDPESEQYKAAVKWLEKVSGGVFPPDSMSKEQADEQLRYTIKDFDEDGDYVPFGSLAGMAVNDINADERRRIIPISDDIRQMMFDLNKEEFIKWNGMGVDTQRHTVYRAYQEQTPKENRLKGTWTLEQYERMYIKYFVEAVKETDPDWEPGEEFDKYIIIPITRDEIELHVSSDGSTLTLNYNSTNEE